MMETRFIVIQFLHSIGRFRIHFDKFKKLSYFWNSCEMFHVRFPLKTCHSLEKWYPRKKLLFRDDLSYSNPMTRLSASDHRYRDLYLGIFTSVFEASEHRMAWRCS